MSEEELPAKVKKTRKRKPGGVNKATYGSETDKVFTQIKENPNNVFGALVYETMQEKHFSLRKILRETGLWRTRYYSLLLDEENTASTEPELIFRLAQSLGLSPVRLLTAYFQSKKRYWSPTYRAVYQMKEYSPEYLAELTASFVFLWEAVVHSPRFEGASPEEQGEQALHSTEILEAFWRMNDTQQRRSPELLEAFLQMNDTQQQRSPELLDAFSRMSDTDQETILKIARSFAVKPEAVEIDPHERAESQTGIWQKKLPGNKLQQQNREEEEEQE